MSVCFNIDSAGLTLVTGDFFLFSWVNFETYTLVLIIIISQLSFIILMTR